MSVSMEWPRKWRLGVPYQGSKNQIARDIIRILPSGKRFVDLFAGGCAITHAAIISGKYDTFLVNDLHGFGVRLFMDAISGKCNGRWREWVSREEFMSKRDSDPLISLCWSFGNNMSQYLYGKEIEETKRAWHHERVDNELKSEGRVQGLVQTEALERLQALERPYEDYVHEAGDVVYCDIPYRSSSEKDGSYRFMKRRGMSFDFDRFYDWVQTRDYPVFVSEYEMPTGFTPIWKKDKICMFTTKHGERNRKVENVFVASRYAKTFQTDLFVNLNNTAGEI